ncbi:hypothetical protein F0U60_50775 [Archangium minus]|uniref:Lipoprotein n=1 Tax=Archangium minus TaxID=83450 RepID=A0ABY9X7Y7_9BACT|nr:hypothetical protein F0U60_50775 [Archangium minus]
MTSRILSLFALLMLSACAEDPVEEVCREEPCPAVYTPPVSLSVRSPAGQPLPDIIVTGVENPSCNRLGPEAISCFIGTGPGQYVLDIQAEGFEPVHLEVNVFKRERTTCDCCSPGYTPQSLGIQLEPAT